MLQVSNRLEADHPFDPVVCAVFFFVSWNLDLNQLRNIWARQFMIFLNATSFIWSSVWLCHCWFNAYFAVLILLRFFWIQVRSVFGSFSTLNRVFFPSSTSSLVSKQALVSYFWHHFCTLLPYWLRGRMLQRIFFSCVTVLQTKRWSADNSFLMLFFFG